MVSNYLKIAWRHFIKNKLFSIINVLGLSLGLSIFIVIALYVQHELSFDSYHSQAGNIYRTVTSVYKGEEKLGTYPLSPYAQVPMMQEEIPEIKSFIRTHPMYGNVVVSVERDGLDPLLFVETNAQFADSSYFNYFDHTFIEGNASALMQPESVVVTKSTALKYFNTTENVVGKSIHLSGGWANGDFIIKAIIEDVPDNAHFQFDFLLPVSKLLQNNQYKDDDGWGWSNFYSYVVLHDEVIAANLAEKIASFLDKYQGEAMEESGRAEVLHLQPITSIHLTPGYEDEVAQTNSVKTVYFFMLIAAFILFIAWINYINLSTSKSIERAREIGIKKAMGVTKEQLIAQFLSESFLINSLSIICGLLFTYLLLPILENYTGYQFQLPWSNLLFWLSLSGMLVFGTLATGIYPALVMTNFEVLNAIQSKVGSKGNKQILRKGLVVFQFVISMLLIAGTYLINTQINFLKSNNNGLDMDRIVVVDGPTIYDRDLLKNQIKTFKNELLEQSSIQSVATSGTIPGGGFNWGTNLYLLGKEETESVDINLTWVDVDFIQTFDIPVSAGVVWNLDKASDMEKVVINQTAVRSFGIDSDEAALQEKILIGEDTVGILAVLEDFHWNSMKTEHVSVVFAPGDVFRSHFSIKVNSDAASIEKIRTAYASFFPGNPFNYYFLQDHFNKQYKSEEQFGGLFLIFSFIAVFIAFLGLWALTAYSTYQRKKEIGIRKVLGARMSQIFLLLTTSFLKLVGWAVLIGIPVIIIGGNHWLNDFANKVSVDWVVVLVPAIILLGFTLVTISYHVLQSAFINPAQELKAE